MANPQAEDGHTKIANEILDALISANLSGQEMRITLFVIRKTYGYNKVEDFIALSQMMKALRISKVRASQVVNTLELMKILTVTENINGLTKKYKFNKDFDQWDTVKENLNRKGFTKQTVKVLRNRPLRKTLTTKDNIQKTITKDKALVILPENINPETWSAYLEMRKTIKKPATIYAQKLIIGKLAKMRDDPNKVLEQSISNSYQGVFPLKEELNARTTTNFRDKRPAVCVEQDKLADDINAEYYRRKALETANNPTGNT